MVDDHSRSSRQDDSLRKALQSVLDARKDVGAYVPKLRQLLRMRKAAGSTRERLEVEDAIRQLMDESSDANERAKILYEEFDALWKNAHTTAEVADVFDVAEAPTHQDSPPDKEDS